MNITSENQLVKMMGDNAEKALSKAAEEVLVIFKRDYIEGIAYIKDPKEYQRTMEFEDAWDFTELKRDALRIYTELWYNPGKLVTLDIDNFIHGSIYSRPEDIRASLPYILEGKQSSLWISVHRDKKFWEEFLIEMLSNGKLKRIMDKHLKAFGFVSY